MLFILLLVISCGFSNLAMAHHSFASYDFDKQMDPRVRVGQRQILNDGEGENHVAQCARSDDQDVRVYHVEWNIRSELKKKNARM